MGHTKQYTKVVLTQSTDILGVDQPAQALIGKCVKIKVTGTHKWHISGYIIDAAPKPIEVSPDYFEVLDRQRKEKLRLELQNDLAIQKKKEVEKRQQLASLQAASNKKENENKAHILELQNKALILHFMGVMSIGVGVYMLLRNTFL